MRLAYAGFGHGPQRQPDGIDVVEGGAGLDDTDDGEDHDDDPEREHGR